MGLSFTALSPLVMGGIIGAAFITLAVVFGTLGNIKEENFSKKDFFFGIYSCVIAAAVGVGLAAAATAIFPTVTIGTGSAALAGAAIGVIAPIAALCATVSHSICNSKSE